jgi:tetratricopeptide (TPR) repeat protein
LWWVNFGRGQMTRALALAQRVLALGDSTGDPNLQITGSIATGSTLTHMGNLVDAQRHLERGYSVFRSGGARLDPSLFVQDPGVELLCYLALLYWWRGEPNRAREAIAHALRRSEELRHSLTTLLALHFAGVLQLLDGQFDLALKTSAKAIAIIAKQRLVGGGPTAHSWTHGCALTALGDPDTGLTEMRRGLEFCLQRGMLLGLTGYYFLYGEACCMARRYAEAATAIDEGLAFAAKHGENVLVAPMHRIKGVLLLANGDRAGAEATLQTAIAMARQQGARCFELGSLLSWCRLPQVSRNDAVKALRAAVVGYGEGDTLMIQAARTTLAEWESGPSAASRAGP